VVIGALFVITGGIRIEGSLSGTPLVNTGMLGIGAVLREPRGDDRRVDPAHPPPAARQQVPQRTAHIVVFFIFVVAKLRRSAHADRDPPLLLGFLKGVPFEWTLRLWPQWLTTCAVLLAVFNVWDQGFFAREKESVLARSSSR